MKVDVVGQFCTCDERVLQGGLIWIDMKLRSLLSNSIRT